MIAPKRKKLYFKYTGRLIFDSSSYNVIGTDVSARYRIVPDVLKEIMAWSSKSASVDYGYVRDEETGLYLKNLDISDEEAIVEFITMKLKAPFGYHSTKTYSEYSYRTFNEDYQGVLKRYFDSSLLEKISNGTETHIEDTFCYYYTLLVKKSVRENEKPLVRVSYN